MDYIFRELAVSYLDRTDLAHVKPEGESFSELGRGNPEGVRNFTEAQDEKGLGRVSAVLQCGATRIRSRNPSSRRTAGPVPIAVKSNDWKTR